MINQVHFEGYLIAPGNTGSSVACAWLPTALFGASSHGDASRWRRNNLASGAHAPDTADGCQ